MFRSLVGHFFKKARPTLDNFVFRLHYRVTVGLLLTCAVALLWKINYGNPIICVMTDEGSALLLNDHCWYDGTFTVPSARHKSVGSEVPAPGIDGGPDKEYHNVHRWVVIAVLVQAAFFYLPRIIWRSLEGRLVPRWTRNMSNPKVTSTDMYRKELIANYLKVSSFRNLLYAGGHVLCELLNLINVVVQLFLVSHILQMSFPSVDLFVKSRSERTDASALSAFPLKTKCNLFKYGRSGDVQKHDASCVMSINGVMESIFIYQWIWFALLAILSVLALLYRVASLVVPPFRTLRLSSKANLTNRFTLEKTAQHLGIGEWFVLYMLSKNLDPLDTKDIIERIGDSVTGKEVYPLTEASLLTHVCQQ